MQWKSTDDNRTGPEYQYELKPIIRGSMRGKKMNDGKN